jgi:hypothetical protein
VLISFITAQYNKDKCVVEIMDVQIDFHTETCTGNFSLQLQRTVEKFHPEINKSLQNFT